MNLRRCFSADFETTTDENDCRVWAYALCNIDDPTDFRYGNSIEDFIKFCADPKINYKLWFHNLKFDSSYVLSFLLSNGYTWISDRKEKADKTFTTLISSLGQYYNVTIYFKVKGHHTNKVEIYDSLKIFPNFSVERVAEAFKMPIRKLELDYHTKREKGHILTKEEVDYIRNDVEIMARALREMFSRGLTKMTIASDAINDYKENHIKDFRRKFPKLPKAMDEDIRSAYRGGFTYANEVWREKKIGKGLILDVNSLYPSCMHSPYMLPFGMPLFFEGEYQEDKAYPLYVQNFTAIFELKEGKIPSIQIRNNLSFIANEYVTSSKGKPISLYLTRPDFELFKEQYNIIDIKYHGGWKFMGAMGLFDSYIDYWTEQKIKAGKEGNAPQRAIAKLQLNSLYGKFGSSGKGREKSPFLGSDGKLKFVTEEIKERETVYVPVAAYVTAYGRMRTIKTSQAIKDYTKEKYGEDRYYYSDTDSIHAGITDEDLEVLKDIIKVDDFKLGYWAKEGEFTRAIYIRQKCYVEEIDGKLDVTVAGLPKYLAPLITFENFKRGFTTEGLTQMEMVKLASKNGATEEEIKKLHPKLTYKYVKGGVILADTDFTIK